MSPQPAKVSSRASFPRLVLCAIIGAIAVSAVPLLPTFIPLIGQGTTAEGGGAQTLVYFVWMTGENIVQKPWGLIGALAGAGIGWLILRPRCVKTTRKVDE